MKHLLLMTILLGAVACGGDEPTLLDNDEIVVAEERVQPEITLLQPIRGTFSTGVAIVVSGSVTAGSSPITSVEVNGVAAPLTDGFFTADVALENGPNIIGIRAEAEDGGRAVEAVTVFGGDVRPPGESIANAVQVHLGREFLDDNDPDLDDISSIVELVVADEPFLESLTAEPFDVGGEAVTVTRIEVGSAAVDLVPETNCIDASITIRDAEIDLTTTGIAAILGDQVFVTANGGTVEMLLCGTDVPGEFEVVQSDISFDNLLLATNDNPDLATDLPSVHATLVNLLESAIGSWLGGSLGGFLTELLGIFQLEYTFGSLTFSYGITELSAHPDGLELFLSGSVTSPFGLPAMPAGAGSLRTNDARLGDAFSSAPLALAMSDDAINQLLFAYWWSGSIADYALDPAALEQLPEVFQPLSSFEVALGLPPTLLAPTQPEYPFDIAVGEVGLLITAGTDRVFDTGIHFRTGVDMAIDEMGGIGMAMDGRAQKINVQANVATSPPSHEKGDVAALLRLIVPSVLGGVEVSYGGFPIPDLQLSAFSANVAAFQGRAVGLTPAGTSRQGEGGGYLVLEGSLTER